MTDRLVALIVDESKWLTVSMAVALLATAILLSRQRRSGAPVRHRIQAAMSLYFGVTIGTMAFGHLLAVTTKLALGTLVGPVLLFYLIGVALAVPSWWLIVRSLGAPAKAEDAGRWRLGLNACLVVTLLVMGIHNLPLAAPGILNVAYALHSRRKVGWAIVGTAVVVNLGLFVGSLVFLASGQTFEQFHGIQ